MFANAEEEFFYEVTSMILLIYCVSFSLHISRNQCFTLNSKGALNKISVKLNPTFL